MPLDYRIYDNVSPFKPAERYQAGVQRGQNNLLFKQLMEDRAEQKQEEAENKNILSTYERVDGVLPYLRVQNYEGANEWLNTERERILSDIHGADLRDTDGLLDLINKHQQGDHQVLGHISSLH